MEHTGHLCRLCSVKTASTYHHIIPKSMKFVLKGRPNRLMHLCSYCHKFIHKEFTNRDLAFRLNTEEKLRAEPEIRKFIYLMQCAVKVRIKAIPRNNLDWYARSVLDKDLYHSYQELGMEMNPMSLSDTTL